MHKLLPLGLASLFLVVTGCQDTNTTGPLAGPSFAHAAATHDFEFDMNDRFATETGASGSGQADVEGGSVEIEVKAEGLIPNHRYELNVTIDFASVVTFGPVTANEDGEVEFEGDLDLLSLLGAGTYRLDFFVTHDHTTGVDGIPGLLNRDLLLACQPAVVGLVIS